MNLIQELLAAQREIDRGAVASILANVNIQDIIAANNAVTNLFSQGAITDSMMLQIFSEHNALQESLKLIVDTPSMLGLFTSADADSLLYTSINSQIRFLELEKYSIGNLIGATNTFSSALVATFSELTTSYHDVIESIPTISDEFIPFVATYVPLEYTRELDVIENITIEADDDQEPEPLLSLDNELASLDERLLILLHGARQSLKSDNPEKVRHVTTSVRELFTHTLHQLAPDSEIKFWTSDESHYHNGRPTRRARLLFICRTFSCDPLTKFIEDDVRAALSLVDTLNAGTHTIESKLTQSQLQAIIYRMESLILFLLKASRGGD